MVRVDFAENFSAGTSTSFAPLGQDRCSISKLNLTIVFQNDPAVKTAQRQQSQSPYPEDCGWIVVDVVDEQPVAVVIHNDLGWDHYITAANRREAEDRYASEHDPNLTFDHVNERDEPEDQDEAAPESENDELEYLLAEVDHRPTIFDGPQFAQEEASAINKLGPDIRKRIGLRGRARVAFRLLTQS